ncbi:NAD-dependent epimerase/dehydratase family protein [Vibrio sp. 10N.261.52.C2]|uniref:NAD-dependent epimerase/dehydratase family protein n=1 Tax=Vibrio sp. 10N.261.52.C2 TaxID=3229681 RepID=UPI003550EE3F
MNILLTGASGFLGLAISKKVDLNSHTLIRVSRRKLIGFIQCDLASVSEVQQLFDNTNPDLIIHCAAEVPKNIESYNDRSIYHTNTKMVANLSIDRTIPFVYISSMTVYGDCKRILYNESDECFPDSEYAISKLEGEDYIKEHCDTSIILRIPGLYSELKKSGLVHNIIMSILKEKKIELPKDKIQWAAMHVDDAASSIVDIINSMPKNKTINVGYENKYSINDLIANCNSIFEGNVKCHVEHPEFQFDLNLLKELSSMPPQLTLKDSLENMKKYYIGENDVK